MNGFFRVDLGALDKVALALNQAGDLMGEALYAMGQEGGKGFFDAVTGDTLGTTGLDEACGGFESAWLYGLEQIQNDIKSITEGVQANRQSYQQVDNAVAAAMGTLNGGPGVTGLTMADFPALGFNPSPGDPEIAAALAERLQKAVAALREGNQVITKLETGDSAEWQGAAADAFRAHVATSAELPKALRNADRSLTIAQQQLSKWSESLVGYQSTALALEQAAATQRTSLQQAQSAANQSAANTNLSFFDSADISLSQQQVQAGASAKAAVLEAEATLEEYQAQLTATIQQAQAVLQEHDNQANGVAEILQYSPLAFAPSRPDWLHRAIDDLGGAIDWLHSHAQAIGDICATLSAIVGVLALIPPLTAVCAPLAIALSAVALGMHLWAGDHSALDIGGDVLGMVPGLDLVTDALKDGRIGMQVVDDASIVARDGDSADDVLHVAKDGTYIKGADAGVKWLASKVISSGVSDVWTDADAVSKSLGEGIENAQSTFKWLNGSIAFAYTRVGLKAVSDDFHDTVANAASHVDAATDAVTSGLATGIKDLL